VGIPACQRIENFSAPLEVNRNLLIIKFAELRLKANKYFTGQISCAKQIFSQIIII
jgi:hypothetical protein